MEGLFNMLRCLDRRHVATRRAAALYFPPNPAPSPSSFSQSSSPINIACGNDSVASLETRHHQLAAVAKPPIWSSARTIPSSSVTETTGEEQAIMQAAHTIQRRLFSPESPATASALLVRSVSSYCCLETAPSPSANLTMHGLEAVPCITHSTSLGSFTASLNTNSGSPGNEQASSYNALESQLPAPDGISVSCAEVSAPVTLYVHKYRRFTMRWFLFPYVLHSTVEYKGIHYTFGGGGRYTSVPARGGWAVFKCIPMGDSLVPCSAETSEISAWIKSSYHQDSYHGLQHNCNDYCSELCWMLVRKESPIWINMLARRAERLLCLKPLDAEVKYHPLPHLTDLQQPQPVSKSSQPSSSESRTDVSSCTPLMIPSLAPSTQNSLLSSSSPSQSATDLTALQPVPSSDSSQHSPVIASFATPTSPDSSSPRLDTITHKTSASLQELTLQPEVPLQPTATPPPQPSDTSGAPCSKPNCWHRPDWVKPVWPKNFRQKAASLFCCGRAGKVKHG